MSIEKEKTIDHRMMYEGKLLHVYYDEVDIAGETYRREIVEHPGAAAIIPVTEDGEILFVSFPAVKIPVSVRFVNWRKKRGVLEHFVR